MTRFRKILSAGVAFSLALGGAAFAAGGGGGGGGGMDVPSASGPTYDPAVEYAKGVSALNGQNYKDAEKAFKRVVAARPTGRAGFFDDRRWVTAAQTTARATRQRRKRRRKRGLHRTRAKPASRAGLAWPKARLRAVGGTRRRHSGASTGG